MKKRIIAILATALVILGISTMPAWAVIAGKFGDTEVMGAPLTWSGGTIKDAALMHIDLDDGNVVQVYCINNNLGIPNNQRYVESDWNGYTYTDFHKNNKKIAWVLGNSYPNVSAATVGAAAGVPDLTVKEAITATQLTVWMFVDEKSAGVDYPAPGDTSASGASSQRMQSVIDYLSENAKDTKQPVPTVQLAPDDIEGTVNDVVGPFVVSTTANSVALTADNGVIVDENNRPVTQASNGDELFLDTSDSTVGAASMTAQTPRASLDVGRIFISENGRPSQELVAAQTIEVAASDTARGSLTAGPTAPPTTPTPTTPAPTPTTPQPFGPTATPSTPAATTPGGGGAPSGGTSTPFASKTTPAAAPATTTSSNSGKGAMPNTGISTGTFVTLGVACGLVVIGGIVIARRKRA